MTASNYTASTGATINEFSTDGNLTDNSNTAVPTEYAVKTYVDSFNFVATGGTITDVTIGGTLYRVHTASDFNLTQPFIVIQSGNTTGTTVLNVVNDYINDLTDTLIITLDSVYNSAGGLIIGSSNRVNLIVLDDDDAISLNAMNVTQQAANFNNLPAQFGGNLLFDFPKGFYLNETGANANQSPTSYAGGFNGNTSFGGDAFVLGSPGSTERAIGSGCSGSLEATYGFKLINNTGSAISQMKIS